MSGQQVTQNAAADVVVLFSLASVPVTGLTFSNVTAQYMKEGDVSFSAFTLDGTNFTEIGNGVYTIQFTASELDTVGAFTVVVTGATIDQSTTIVTVLAATQATTTSSVQTCLISGHVFNASGKPEVGAAVFASVIGLPSVEQNAAVVTDERVTVTTNTNGEFFLTLVRLADVEVSIPTANYRRRLVVPNTTSALLFDIA